VGAGQPCALGRPAARKPGRAITEARALALRALAHRQADVGRYQEALASAEQAYNLYQAMMNEPDRWRRDLARSMDVLGRRYADAGQWGQTVTILRKARDEYNRVEQEYQEAERGRHAELLETSPQAASAGRGRIRRCGTTCSGKAGR
jgi:tetratricopeptide (TPR) repeat protein